MRRSPHTAALLATLVLALLGVAHPTTSASAVPARKATAVSGWAGAPSGVTSGSPYVARLWVSGHGRTVHLQRRTGGEWRTVDTARSARNGRVSLVWRAPSQAVRATLRVLVRRTEHRRRAVTHARVVTVRTPATPGTPGTPGTSEQPSPNLSAELTEVLRLVNRARAQARSCGGVRYPAVPPLRTDARLNRAADKYARLMGTRGFFSHTGPDGSDPGDRMSAEGYRWASYGENIAAGYSTAAAVVDAWLDSPGHCQNIMGRSTELGLGHAHVPGSPYGTYWVQDFATPR
jgi:uncharacterized protein YkwD